MVIQRWEPIREAVSLRDARNSLPQESFVRPIGLLAVDALAISLYIQDNENNFIIKASLPGVRPEDVQIAVHGDTLTILGQIKAEDEEKDEHYHQRERRYGQFGRTVSLSTPITADKAKAQLENGLLKMRLPKAEEAKPKQIKVAPSSTSTMEMAAAGASETG